MTLPRVNGSPVPSERPRGARNVLSRKIIADFTEAWHDHGATCLDIMTKEDPGRFVQIATAILPRDVLVSVEQAVPGGLDPQDWALLMRVLDLIKASIPAGASADPGEVFGIIETALREHYAKAIGEAGNG